MSNPTAVFLVRLIIGQESRLPHNQYLKCFRIVQTGRSNLFWDLIINDDDTMIADILNERVMSVHVGMIREDVAQTFRDYDFLASPVTDYDDHLLGS